MRKHIGRRDLLAGAAVTGAAGLVGPALAADAPPLEGEMAGWAMEADPRPVPDFTLRTPQNDPLGPADFAGRLILMNFWATWCVPCVAEMGALDRLQADYEGQPFEVVAVSIDRGGPVAVTPFFEENGIESLATYLDPTGGSPMAFKARGIPTTVLISPDGRLLGRYEGAAEWDGPEAKALIDYFLAGTT